MSNSTVIERPSPSWLDAPIPKVTARHLGVEPVAEAEAEVEAEVESEEAVSAALAPFLTNESIFFCVAVGSAGGQQSLRTKTEVPA